MEANEHFNNLPVNTQMSNIQVPTNVYNRGTVHTHTPTHTACIPACALQLVGRQFFFIHFFVDPDILNGAYMSEALNEVFIDNFQKDPTLTWQYFGSSAGFFRLYPGVCVCVWKCPSTSGLQNFCSFVFLLHQQCGDNKIAPLWDNEVFLTRHGQNCR